VFWEEPELVSVFQMGKQGLMFLQVVTIRAIGKRAHPLHSVSFFCIWSCIVSSVGMIILRIPIVLPQNFLFAVLILGIGIFGFITQLFLTMGLQRETASRGALGVYVQIIFAAIAERWIFHTKPSYLSIIGSIIIVVSAVFVAVSCSSTNNRS
jgi:drug/metabolite transporter (DMT)-like permease